MAIRFLGMKRSGNHAIIHWLICQMSECVYFANAVKVGPRPPSISVYQDGNVVQFLEYSEGQYPWPWIYMKPFDCLNYVYNLEDVSIDLDLHMSKNDRSVIILRDPFNLFSSRRRHREKNPGGSNTMGEVSSEWVELWRSYAKGCLAGCDQILYNKWFSSREYRNSVSTSFGLEFSDRGLNDVTHFGGSTWDGLAKDGHAQEMNVLNRYKKYPIDFFNSIFDEEIYELCDTLFGFAPPRKLAKFFL